MVNGKRFVFLALVIFAIASAEPNQQGRQKRAAPKVQQQSANALPNKQDTISIKLMNTIEQ